MASVLPDLSALLVELWGVLPPPKARDAAVLRFRVERHAPGGFLLRGPVGTIPLDPKRPALHAYNSIVEALLGRVDRAFALHATTVTWGECALVLAGPAGFGKSTLGWALTGEGAALLADDVTFLERSGGRLLPFPRMLRPRRAAADDGPPPAFDHGPRRQPADIPLHREPARPTWVVLLHKDDEEDPRSRFPLYELGIVEGQAHRAQALRDLPGVERLEVVQAQGLALRLWVADSRQLQAWIAAHRDALVYAVKLPAGRPRFAGAPRLTGLSRFRAALELCQEMLNRHPGSALAREFAGREPELVGEVAELLRGARCLSLVPGGLSETAAVLGRLLEVSA